MIKEVLLQDQPLYTGQYVTHASITDLYKTYAELMRQENLLRDKRHKLKGMTLHSLNTLFRFAKYLGLVEGVISRLGTYGISRMVFRLTEKGKEDDNSRNDLTGTWRKRRPVLYLPRSMQNG
jgi:hypothetical protein